MPYWNWGVHFGGMDAPNHLSFLRKERIVLGALNRNQHYGLNDLVAITDGMVVLAVVTVLSLPQPITARPRYRQICLDHNIAWTPNTVFAEGDWRVLGRLNIQNGAGEIQGVALQAMVQNLYTVGVAW